MHGHGPCTQDGGPRCLDADIAAFANALFPKRVVSSAVMVLSGKPPECGCCNANKGRVGATTDSSAAKPQKSTGGGQRGAEGASAAPVQGGCSGPWSRKAAKDSAWRLFLPPLRGLAVVAVMVTVGCARAFGTR